MTAVLAFLGHLGPLDWTFIAIAWLLVAFALGTFTGLGIDLADKRKPTPDPVFRIISLYPPAVPWPNKRPPITQADIDATWLNAWPSAVNDDELCNAEFESLIHSNFLWPWPNSEDAA